MDTSLFIARLLGPLLLVVGAATLLNQANIRQMATDFLEQSPLVYVVGVLTLLGGLVIVNTHNVWQGWPVIITIFGWLCVIGGAIRILVPRHGARAGRDDAEKAERVDRKRCRPGARRRRAVLLRLPGLGTCAR